MELDILISVYRVGLCPQLSINKTGRKQTFPVIFAAVVAIKKCFCVLEMNFDSRNKVVYRDAGSETSRSREFVLRLIFSGVCFCRLVDHVLFKSDEICYLFSSLYLEIKVNPK